MRTVAFLLEEPSAKALLEGLMPRLFPQVHPEYLVFDGKQDLERNIPRKLRAWQRPETVFVVLRDQDSGDCSTVKQRLVDRVEESGKSALVRVACRTLEAWVAGDLAAVAEAFEEPSIATRQNMRKFRDPDALGSAYDELRQLVPSYQKIDGARRVSSLLDPASNTSASFKALCSGLKSLLEAPTPTGSAKKTRKGKANA